jgi:hypothetical protein
MSSAFASNGICVPKIPAQAVGGLYMTKFKIGQDLIYRRDQVRLNGRYVVLAVLPQSNGKAATELDARTTEKLNTLPKNAN